MAGHAPPPPNFKGNNIIGEDIHNTLTNYKHQGTKKGKQSNIDTDYEECCT